MVQSREKAGEIDAAATRWVARIDRDGLTPEIQGELDAWMAQDARREGAFLRAQAVFGMLDRLSILGAGQGEPEPEARTLLSRRAMMLGGGATGLLAAGSAGLIWYSQTRWTRIETQIGEMRSIPLADGSTAILNTGTRLAVRMSEHMREVRLEEGEALFEVAKDARRPFVVETGAVRTRAVGTAFAVRRMRNGTDVRVTEGVVEVRSLGQSANVRRVPAGSKTFATDANGPGRVQEAAGDIERSLAWHNGELIFDEDTLADASLEFNRYNRRQIVIADAALRGERITGRFRIHEPAAFAQAAAVLTGARADMTGADIALSRK